MECLERHKYQLTYSKRFTSEEDDEDAIKSSSWGPCRAAALAERSGIVSCVVVICVCARDVCILHVIYVCRIFDST